jgi:hypothetical protein
MKTFDYQRVFASRTYTDNTQQRVPVQKKVTENQRRCQMVRVQAPDQQMVVPVTRLVWSQFKGEVVGS